MGKIGKTCCVSECDKKHYANGYCEKHYWQVRRHGEVVLCTRSKFDNNEIILNGDETATIITYDNHGVANGKTIISDSCVEQVRDKKIGKHTSKDYYYILIDGNRYALHRYLMNAHLSGHEVVVDHINRNPSDNRLSNLRITNHSGNNCNRGLMSNNSLGIKNIGLTKYGTYRVQISLKEKKHSKTFKTLEEAIKWRNETLVALQGDFANIQD